MTKQLLSFLLSSVFLTGLSQTGIIENPIQNYPLNQSTFGTQSKTDNDLFFFNKFGPGVSMYNARTEKWKSLYDIPASNVSAIESAADGSIFICPKFYYSIRYSNLCEKLIQYDPNSNTYLDYNLPQISGDWIGMKTHPTEAKKLVVQSSDKLYASADAGKSWKLISNHRSVYGRLSSLEVVENSKKIVEIKRDSVFIYDWSSSFPNLISSNKLAINRSIRAASIGVNPNIDDAVSVLFESRGDSNFTSIITVFASLNSADSFRLIDEISYHDFNSSGYIANAFSHIESINPLKLVFMQEDNMLSYDETSGSINSEHVKVNGSIRRLFDPSCFRTNDGSYVICTEFGTYIKNKTINEWKRISNTESNPYYDGAFLNNEHFVGNRMTAFESFISNSTQRKRLLSGGVDIKLANGPVKGKLLISDFRLLQGYWDNEIHVLMSFDTLKGFSFDGKRNLVVGDNNNQTQSVLTQYGNTKAMLISNFTKAIQDSVPFQYYTFNISNNISKSDHVLWTYRSRTLRYNANYDSLFNKPPGDHYLKYQTLNVPTIHTDGKSFLGLEVANSFKTEIVTWTKERVISTKEFTDQNAWLNWDICSGDDLILQVTCNPKHINQAIVVTTKGVYLLEDIFDQNTVPLRLENKEFQNMAAIGSRYDVTIDKYLVFSHAFGMRTLSINTTNSIEAVSNLKLSAKLFPNPAFANAKVAVDSDLKFDNVTIYDIKGTPISNLGLNDNSFILPNTISAGSYILLFSNAEGNLKTDRLIVGE